MGELATLQILEVVAPSTATCAQSEVPTGTVLGSMCILMPHEATPNTKHKRGQRMYVPLRTTRPCYWYDFLLSNQVLDYVAKAEGGRRAYVQYFQNTILSSQKYAACVA